MHGILVHIGNYLFDFGNYVHQAQAWLCVKKCHTMCAKNTTLDWSNTLQYRDSSGSFAARQSVVQLAHWKSARTACTAGSNPTVLNNFL